MRRLLSLIVVFGFTHIAAEPLFAQQRLFAMVPGPDVSTPAQLVEIDSRLASLGATVRTFPLAEAPPDKDHVFPFLGGAALVWALNGHVSLLDPRTGALQRVTLSDFVADQVVGTDGNARVVMSAGRCNGTGVTCLPTSPHVRILIGDARSGSQQVLDLGAAHRVGALAYAAAHDLLFVSRARSEEFVLGAAVGRDFFDVDVVQLSTGVVVKTLDVFPYDTSEFRTNEAGTRLLVNSQAMFDVVTGTLTGSISSSLPASLAGALFDDTRQRLLVGGEQVQGYTLDALGLIGTTALPPLPLVPSVPPDVQFIGGDTDVSGQSATIFLARTRHRDAPGFSSCDARQLAAIDADTGHVRAIADAPAFLSQCLANLIRLTEPAAPLGFAVQAAGHQVTFTWQASVNATSYQIEAGSAPGLTNLATVSVSDPHLTVDSVPSGIYYVRVRAVNTIGTSAPSQEIRLVVP